MKKISAIIPMYNEEKVVKECYKRMTNVLTNLNDYDYEIVFIDDGSKDQTFNLLQEIAVLDTKVKIISFTRNFGHQSAVIAGLKVVDGECAIIIDADLQDPPELIPDMIKLWKDGNKIIYGKRKKRKGESIFKLSSAKLFYKTLNMLADVEIPRDTGDFRLVDKEAINVINAMPEHNKFLRGLWSWTGFKQVPFEYEREKRFAGKTKYPFRKMMKLAQDGIIGFSTKPLKIVGALGFFSIIISIVILIYSLLSYILKLNNLEPGWTSIMVTVTLFSGVQLVSLWVISEYIGRIYDESKSRPQYIINKIINIK